MLPTQRRSLVFNDHLPHRLSTLQPSVRLSRLLERVAILVEHRLQSAGVNNLSQPSQIRQTTGTAVDLIAGVLLVAW